jgi:hypothetical protein
MDVEDYISSHTSSSSAPVSLISDLRVSYTEKDRAGVTSVDLSQAHTLDLNGSSEKGNSPKKIESENFNTSGSHENANDNFNASGSNGNAKNNFNTSGSNGNAKDNFNTSGSNGNAKDNFNTSGSNGNAKDNFNTFGERELEDFDLDFGDELELEMNFG